MNNSINYGSFIDLLISSDDDYEPYGITAQPNMAALMTNDFEFVSTQAGPYIKDLDRWFGE